MNYQYGILSWSLLLSFLIILTLSIVAFHHRKDRSGLYLALLTLAISEWAFAGIFEAAATTIPLKMFWSQISYLGIVFTPLFYLLLALAFGHHEKLLTGRNISFAAILPILTLSMAISSNSHNWLWNDIRISDAGNIGLYSHGFWFYIHIGYSYILILAGLVIIFKAAKQTIPAFRSQILILLVGAALPLLSNVVYVFEINPIPGLDWTPIAFSISGVLLALGIFRFDLLDIVPVARKILIDIMTDGVLLIGGNNTVLDINPAMKKIVGRSSKDALGTPISEALSDWPEAQEILEEKLEFETVITKKNGDKDAFYDTRVIKILESDGSIVGRLMVCRDETEKINAQQSLVESQERLKTLSNATTEAIFISEKGICIEQNLTAEKMFGYTLDEAVGKMGTDWIVPEHREQVMQNMLSGYEHPYQVRAQRKDGSTFSAEIQARTMRYRGRDVRITALRDITDRKQAENSLMLSESYIQSILSSAPIGIGVLEDRTFKLVNERFCEMVGYSSAELVGQSSRMVYPSKEEFERVGNSKYGQIQRFGSGSIDTQFLDKDGNIIDVILSSTPINTMDLSQGVTFTAIDISERKQQMENLNLSEERYRTLFNFTPDPIVIHDGKTVLDVNPATIDALGLKDKKNIVGKDPLSFIRPDELKNAQGRIDVLLKDKVPLEPLEFKLLTQDNIEHIVTASPVPISYENKQAIMVTYHDITKRKLMENELSESKKVTERYLNIAAEIIISLDVNGNITMLNESGHKLLEYKPGELIGKNWFKTCIQPEISKEIQSVFKRLMSGDVENVKQYDNAVLTKQGSLKHIRWHNSILKDDQGKISGLLSSGVDITEQRETEKDRRQYEHIVSSSVDLMTLIDKDYCYQAVNDAYLRAFNKTRKEFIGKSMSEILGTELFTTVVKSHADRCLTGEKTNFQTWVNYPALGKRFMDATYNPYYGDDSEVQGFSVVARDITSQKQDDEERSALESQLRQSQKLEAVGTMAGGIAHDFNNILQGMFLYQGIVKDQLPEDEKLRTNFKHIMDAGDRAKDLVKQILTFSRKEDTNLKPTKIQYVIKEALKLMRASTPSSIEFRENINSACGAVLCDLTQMQQVFVNLCNNAAHAMRKSGGVLAVSLQEIETDSGHGNRQVELVVSDTGQGMNAETLELIFDPFFTTKGVGEGTGLGLSIVHGIVKDMHGEIKVESAPGEGTTFRIHLPLSSEEEKLEEIQEEILTRARGQRVLLVDDDDKISGAGKYILEQQGYVVDIAENGLEALELIQKDIEAYDLIITDLTMPKMTGLELGKELRKLSKDLIIVLMSGNLDPKLKSEFESLGFNGFVHKPWTAAEMLKAINSLNLD